MKKSTSLLALIVMMLFCSALAQEMQQGMARVIHCKEFITLRSSAEKKGSVLVKIPLGTEVLCLGNEKNGFTEVSWKGSTGWVLTEYLEMIEEDKGEEILLSDAEGINMNLYLTRFSGSGMKSFLRESASAAQVIGIARDYISRYMSAQIMTGEWPYGNQRVSAEEIQKAAKALLGLRPKDKSTTDGITFHDGMYYWKESGVSSPGGFAIVDKVYRQEEGTYRIEFGIYGEGEAWTPEGVCMLSSRRAQCMYDHDAEHRGSAVVDCRGNLEDATGWKLIRFAVD